VRALSSQGVITTWWSASYHAIAGSQPLHLIFVVP